MADDEGKERPLSYPKGLGPLHPHTIVSDTDLVIVIQEIEIVNAVEIEEDDLEVEAEVVVAQKIVVEEDAPEAEAIRSILE